MSRAPRESVGGWCGAGPVFNEGSHLADRSCASVEASAADMPLCGNEKGLAGGRVGEPGVGAAAGSA